MRNTRLFLIIAVLLAGVPAMMSGVAIGAQADGAERMVSEKILGESTDLLQFTTPLSGPLCADGSLQQEVNLGSTILDSLKTSIVICNTRTCECYDCQFGGPCVPVPPPSWCI